MGTQTCRPFSVRITFIGLVSLISLLTTTAIPSIVTAATTGIISLSGTKFNDVNGNGRLEAGEPGLAGWTIYVDLNGNRALDTGEPSTVTEAGGNWSIQATVPLTSTAVQLREVSQAGWTQTTAPIGLTFPPLEYTGLLFGNHRAAPVVVRPPSVGLGFRIIGDPMIAIRPTAVDYKYGIAWARLIIDGKVRPWRPYLNVCGTFHFKTGTLHYVKVIAKNRAGAINSALRWFRCPRPG